MKFICVQNTQGRWYRTKPSYGAAFSDSGTIVVFSEGFAQKWFGEKLKGYTIVEMVLEDETSRTWAAKSLGSIKSERKAQTSRENGRKSIKTPAQPQS